MVAGGKEVDFCLSAGGMDVDISLIACDLVLRPQIMADSGMPLRMPFQNAQQHTISEHPNYHSFKNI